MTIRPSNGRSRSSLSMCLARAVTKWRWEDRAAIPTMREASRTATRPPASRAPSACRERSGSGLVVRIEVDARQGEVRTQPLVGAWSFLTDFQTETDMNVDNLLKKSIQAELEWEPSIDPADIGIAVENGVVTLTGHVANYAQKIAVEKTVKRLKGVRGIAQNIEVRPYPSTSDSDDVVAQRVINLLDWDVTLPKGAVKARVAHGYVTLSGNVEWAYQRFAAAQGIKNVKGVRGVINEITVKPHVAPANIKKRIEAALERQAEVEASGIRVTVDGGKVRLDGKVPTWRDRDVIERAAWTAPGVMSVEDHVTIGL